MQTREFPYGIVQGYYGKIWPLQTLQAYALFCRQYHIRFFIHAPKADRKLREDWHIPFSDDELDTLIQTKKIFADIGVDFGIGFTPFGLLTLSQKNRQALQEKLQQINMIAPNILAVFFDDLAKEHICADLAKNQLDIAHYCQEISTATSVYTVPTYYSYDALLTRVMGAMPKNYWQDFGKIDKNFNIFWCGDYVLSFGYGAHDFDMINQYFQRKVVLWDNYPVNDPEYLQYTYRILPREIPSLQVISQISAIASNPMQEAFLSQIPMAVFSQQLQQLMTEQQNQPIDTAVFMQTIHTLFGEQMRQFLAKNLNFFTLIGLDKTEPSNIKRMIHECLQISDSKAVPCQNEILAILKAAQQLRNI